MEKAEKAMEERKTKSRSQSEKGAPIISTNNEITARGSQVSCLLPSPIPWLIAVSFPLPPLPSWRMCFWVASLPAALMGIASSSMVDSPRWLQQVREGLGEVGSGDHRGCWLVEWRRCGSCRGWGLLQLTLSSSSA